MSVKRKIKVAATIGRTFFDNELPAAALHSIDIARLNFSHVDRSKALVFIQYAREAFPALKIWQDLPGPKIRVGNIQEGGIRVSRNQKVGWCAEGAFIRRTTKEAILPLIPIVMRAPFEAFQGMKAFSMKDGSCDFRIIDNKAREGYFVAVPDRDIMMRTGKSMNVPELKHESFNSFSKEDADDLRWGLDNGVDIVSLSFVNNLRQVNECREVIRRHSSLNKPHLWAKIETREGYEHFDEIVRKTDGVMLARGDMVPEVGLSQASVFQYDLLRRFTRDAKNLKKDFIIGTHVLGTMRSSPVPTITEINDITNSVQCGATGFLLAIEVSTGAYPGEAISALNRHLSFLDHARP